ncbi:hypothetical protein V2J09_014878 [Rumex salicifolius]
MEPAEVQSPVKGVVIISLPPRDDPSMGKTVTFYTISGDSLQQTNEIQQPPLPIHLPPQNPSNPLRIRARITGSRKRGLLGFLGFSLFLFVLLSSFSPQSPFKLRDTESDSDEDRDDTDTFVLPLFPKLGVRGDKSTSDIELKLGRFVLKEIGGVEIGPHRVNRLFSGSKASEIDSSSMAFPVKGNVYPYGLYFTQLHIGNPPRSYFLDLDTGSDLTWMQCDAPCTSCAKGPNSLYKPTKSKIVPPKDSLCLEVQKNLKSVYCGTCKQCDYEIEYADHSSSMGVLVRDELNLMSSNGSLSKPSVIFGCAYDQQGTLLNSLAKTDGILGLSRSKVSLPAQLASRGIVKNVVGHCLTSNIAGGGYAFIGDELVPYWNMAWTPMVNHLSVSFYETEVARISYGGKKVSLAQSGDAKGRVVFDSGSSYTYLPKQAYADLVFSITNMLEGKLIQDASDATLPLCWHADTPIRTVDDVKHFFRPLTFHFGSKWFLVSTKFQIPAEGYLVTNSKGNVCLGILDGSNVHDGSTFILGDVSFRGKLVVYDNENQRVGWTDSNCKNPKRYKNLPFLAGMDLSF